MSNLVYSMVAALHAAKVEEEKAKATRIAAEEQLARAIGVPEQWEGSKTNDIGEFKVCVKRSMNVKIDAPKLHEFVVENKISSHILEAAFRWKPEIAKKGWENISEQDKAILSSAITKTPGKVSISVEIKKQEEN